MKILFGKLGYLVEKSCFKNKKSECMPLIDDTDDGKKYKERKKERRLRRGFFPVYVGEERKKFWVPISNSPTLKSVLDRHAEYNPLEPISMPGITPKLFSKLLAIIKSES